MVSPQIPPGPDNLDCPFWRRRMSKVCHKCPMWTKVVGRDPNRELLHDTWNCALAWGPTTQLETAQQARQTCATVAKMRDQILESDVVTRNEAATAAATTHKILATGLNEQRRLITAIENANELQRIAAPGLKEIGHEIGPEGTGTD